MLAKRWHQGADISGNIRPRKTNMEPLGSAFTLKGPCPGAMLVFRGVPNIAKPTPNHRYQNRQFSRMFFKFKSVVF